MAEAPRTLVWLASYPKSGNTWLRAFLANYLMDAPVPVPFEAMRKISFGDSSAPAYAELAGRDHRTLNAAELVVLRERNLARIARQGAVNFVKTHNAHVRVAGRWMIPPRLTRGAVYLLRDPRDLVISYADHWGISLAEAAAAMASPRNTVPTNARTVAQFLGDWSGHVRSWTRMRDFRVLVLRYEDILANPEAAFEKTLRFVGAPIDRAALRQATDFSRFDVLAEQEAVQGFREKGFRQERFFRKGTAGQWREALPEDIVRRIVDDHGEVMQRHGYLTP